MTSLMDDLTWNEPSSFLGNKSVPRLNPVGQWIRKRSRYSKPNASNDNLKAVLTSSEKYVHLNLILIHLKLKMLFHKIKDGLRI